MTRCDGTVICRIGWSTNFFVAFSGLRDLLAYDGHDVEDIYCLTFSLTEENYGEQKVIELKPDGANMSVNQVRFFCST